MQPFAHLSFGAALVIATVACTTDLGSRNGNGPTTVDNGDEARTSTTKRTNGAPASAQELQTFRADLEQSGFDVAEGAWSVFTIDDCKYARASLGNCVGNNPAAPYVIPTVPLWPNEPVESPNPERSLVFASVGDTINNEVIERQAGAAFGERRAIIITADAAMARELTDELVQAGVVERDQVFVEPVSSQLARIGLEESADDFITILRYSQPEDEAAGDRWREELPLTLLRVRDTDRDRATEPYPLTARRERKGTSELSLKEDVDGLVTAVKQQWDQRDVPDGEFASLLLMVDLLGEDCLKRPMNCLGDNSDADYQISPTVSLDEGEVAAVVGVLGTTTGNATYVSLAPNWIPALQGIGNVSGDDLKGSAAGFADSVGNTDKLYVHYFARDCGQLSNCLEISEEMVPRGDSLKLIQRNYVVPGTASGPDPNLLVNPRLIVFDGRQRPDAR